MNKIRKASFDQTHFGDAKKFRDFLKANKMRYLGKHRRYRRTKTAYTIYQWGNKDVLMGTYGNPLTGALAGGMRRPSEKGYASYIGIKGKPEASANLVRSIKKRAEWYKAFDASRLAFVGVGKDPRKKKKGKR